MTTVRYLDMELTLPGGWRDATTFVMVGPPPNKTLLPMVSQPAPPIAPTFVVRREASDDPEAIKEIARREQELLMGVEGVEIIRKEEREIAFGSQNVRALVHEFQLPGPGLPIRQIQAFAHREGHVYALVGTFSLHAGADAHRKTFFDTIASINLHPPKLSPLRLFDSPQPE